MTWDEVCDDPTLRDLPFKVETNRWGEIVMSPAKSKHAVLQGKVSFLLQQLLPQGQMSVEFPLETSDGVKVPDVVWMSSEFYAVHREQDVFTSAPEIVVEVLSEANSPAQMREKAGLFFESGAREVWLVERSGKVRFFSGLDRELVQSALCPAFPPQINL